MRRDWRLRLIGAQGILFALAGTLLTILYLTRPRYAPGQAYEAAHDRWDLTMDVVGFVAFVTSLCITVWFQSRYNSEKPRFKGKALG